MYVNKTFLSALALFTMLLFNNVQAAESDSVSHTFRTLPNSAFGIGEELVFNVDYGLLNAGQAVMKIKDMVTISDRPCYHIVTTATSNKFVSAFYKVNDVVESFIDTAGLFSWKFTKELHEGTWWSRQNIQYNQTENLCYSVTETKKKIKTDTLKVPAYVQDILSVFYYTRTVPLVPGTSFNVETQADRKVYPLQVKVLAKERIKVPAGKFKCIKVEPVLRSNSIFKQKDRIWIWLTDDERRLPVLVKSKIKIGSISIRLARFNVAQ